MTEPAISICANCDRRMVHSRTYTEGMPVHEARGLCRDCYGNKKNRARLVSQRARDCIEQAVARGHRPSRIMRDCAVDYETYRKVRDAMDSACQGGEVA